MIYNESIDTVFMKWVKQKKNYEIIKKCIHIII